MDFLTEHYPNQPALDMALSAALLRAVAAGTCGEAVRLYRPGASVAFGRSDTKLPGFAEASQAARDHGRVPIIRLAGGHAAAYDHDCLIFEIFRTVEHVVGDLDGRYQELTDLVQEASGASGAPLQLGELPGEYCPGRFSLHLPNGPKVAGLAQRVIKGAALTTAVLVVRGGEALRATIYDVYTALGLAVTVDAGGAISDSFPSVTTDVVEAALRGLILDRLQATPASVSPAVISAARLLATDRSPSV